MKKFLPYILIFTVVVQLFAPFGFGVGENNPRTIEENKAEAGVVTECKTLDDFKKAFSSSSLTFNGSIVNKETEATSIDIHIKIDTGVVGSDAGKVYMTCTEINGETLADKDFLIIFQDKETKETGYYDATSNIKLNSSDTKTLTEFDQTLYNINSITGLTKFKPNTEYTMYLYYQAYGGGLVSSSPANNQGEDVLGDGDPDYFKITSQDFSTATIEQGFNGTTGSGEKKYNNHDFLPACNPVGGTWLTGEGSFMGCVVQLFYYVLFIPTSWIFALTGVMLDATVYYSIHDTSYRSTFVVEGWKIIRDFCNMFFIFVLLYIAFGTILKVHTVKTQEMIINVVIIGLLINFSLFATQVIIDASNILTRVFYNSSAIKITEGGKNGVTENTPRLSIGENGEIPISAAIVNKLNPQNLIFNGKEKISVTAGGESSNGATKADDTGIGIGSWIILIVMASIVNVVGLITFLSASLIFIARVIGLWMAMIFAPIAFFSYIVPQLQDVKMIGWKKWWPDTLKMAFLAPIFVFLLYLIVMFLDVGLGFVEDNIKGASGLAYFVSMIVPFVFIMILMMKAKDVAKDMSGELGQSITKGIAGFGGAILGGAALGTAFLGRNLIGRTTAWASKSESSKFHAEQKMAYNKKLEDWKNNGKVGDKPKWSDHIKDNTLEIDGKKVFYNKKGETVKYKNNMRTRIGGLLNRTQEKTNEVDRARSHTNEDMEKAGFKGMKWDELSGTQQNIVEESVRKTNYTKYTDEAERDVRRKIGKDTVDSTGKLADLNSAEKAQVKDRAKEIAVEKFEGEIKQATQGVNAFTRVLSKTNTGSYDIRKLATANVDKNASIFTKIPVGLIAGVATGVRSGILKSAGLSNGGVKVEGKFLDDLKSVLKDSLKNIKVELPESHDHGGGKQVGHGDSGSGHH